MYFGLSLSNLYDAVDYYERTQALFFAYFKKINSVR